MLSEPVCFQNRSSAACVPLLSPREMKSALSLAGPTRMKSLYMTG
ncbi:Uncharacterised protein [Bordetella pertussis]|nr:Uncharacterised protein [Bordetella pertussis]